MFKMWESMGEFNRGIKCKKIRVKLDILYDVLNYCLDKPRRKTQIIHHCNLNPTTFTEYFTKCGFLDVVYMRGYIGYGYRTSKDGIEFLKVYAILLKLMEDYWR